MWVSAQIRKILFHFLCEKIAALVNFWLTQHLATFTIFSHLNFNANTNNKFNILLKRSTITPRSIQKQFPMKFSNVYLLQGFLKFPSRSFIKYPALKKFGCVTKPMITKQIRQLCNLINLMQPFPVSLEKSLVFQRGSAQRWN